MRRVLLCCLLVTLTVFSYGQAALRAKDVVFHSASLDRDMKYRVLLPASYSSSDNRLPVLYLLHGLHGDYTNWDTLTSLEHYAENLSLIVVMPDADDSWYTNSATVPRDKFEDYVAKDLIAEIDHKYRTTPLRQARAIAGLSMGGYAAIKLALRYPDSFIVAGSLSGALNVGADLDKREPEYRERILQVFGPNGSETRSDNNVFWLLGKANPSQLPYLYLGCGTGDGFLATNRDFVQQLSAHKVAYEYHETPGAHAWDYWDRSLHSLLPVMVEKLASPKFRKKFVKLLRIASGEAIAASIQGRPKSGKASVSFCVTTPLEAFALVEDFYYEESDRGKWLVRACRFPDIFIVDGFPSGSKTDFQDSSGKDLN